MNYYRFSIFPFVLLELLASVLFVFAFGFGNFLIFLLASVIVGVILLAVFWKNMLEFQLLRPKEMLAQFAYIIAAFLFIVPGVLSSCIAFFILIFALIFKGKKRQKQAFANFSREEKPSKSKVYDEEIIDVEIIKE
ncbi:integral memnbrane protein [Campylobacter sp. MIT 12-5580]|uniref:integral memnbrane protein n=1 Tax=Campylobacter sp. MIT 12-5580 TaxID=2040651 RepID=UPI0010F7441A|nr:integral memnbrane protein [Campylobacter sp. MIT 12-5580]TKX29014.1 integral memnbrane protein [Campylobacter sp. MIT 12-5580]